MIEVGYWLCLTCSGSYGGDQPKRPPDCTHDDRCGYEENTNDAATQASGTSAIVSTSARTGAETRRSAHQSRASRRAADSGCSSGSEMMTAEQRYRQAMQKAAIVSKRNVAAWMRGERGDSGPPRMDLERQFIIAEIDRLLNNEQRA
jgi:hypothetical protein